MKMETELRMLLVRKINHESVEMYQIKDKLYSKVKYLLMMFDMHRRDSEDDYKEMKWFDKEDFEVSENIIKAVIIFDKNKKISTKKKEELYEIVSGFLEDKSDCAWNLSFYEMDLCEYLPIRLMDDKVCDYINKVYFKVTGDNLNLQIKNETYNNLIQK